MILFADDSTSWLVDFVATQGISAAIVLGMIVFAWKYAPKAIDKCIQIAEGVLSSLGMLTVAVQENTTQTRMVGETTSALANKLFQTMDPKGAAFRDHVFSTAGTNAALLQLSHIIQEGLDHIKDDGMDHARRTRIENHLREIDRLLRTDHH